MNPKNPDTRKKIGIAVVDMDDAAARPAQPPAGPPPGASLESPSPVQPPSAPAPDGAKRPALPEKWFLCKQGSVVSKVAKILIHQDLETRWEHTIRLEEGCLPHKVLSSLQPDNHL